MAGMTAVFLCTLLVLTLTHFATADSGVSVFVMNPSREGGFSAPVTAGIPFGRGMVRDPAMLSLEAGGKPVALQARTAARWPDGSCRWVFLDFQADVPAGGEVELALRTSPARVKVENPVTVDENGSSVTLSNGVICYNVETGGSGGMLTTLDGKTSAEITSTVEIGPRDDRVTSKVVIDSFEVYESGPMRAAVSLYGRRLYSDGIEGPFSQRVEMFAGSPYIRVEDTFVYAHVPGTHAEPRNPLGLWKVSAAPQGDKDLLKITSLMYDEEAEGLVVSDREVAFWGKDEPFDLSRWTDEELVGEDTPGIALGLAKSAAVAVGLVANDKGAGKPVRDIFAHATPEVYAATKVLGDFAPLAAGKFEDVERGMARLLEFWMWFQDNDPKGAFDRGPWHGIFDWGDWQCSYSNRKTREPGWTYHEGRYGWDCNEMDTTLMLWCAFFHDTRPSYWRAAMAMSRHMMDAVSYTHLTLPTKRIV